MSVLFCCGDKIIDGCIFCEAEFLRYGIIKDSRYIFNMGVILSKDFGKFFWAQEFFPLMGSLWDESQDIFGSGDSDEEGCERSIDG